MAEAPRSCVLVTGGSSGIGFELARTFAEQGHDVIIAAYDTEKLEQSAELLRERAPAAIETMAADLATEEGIYALHRQLKESGRKVDIFCANAGIGSGGGDFSETDLGRELELIDLNVRGQVQLTKLVVRDMLANGGGQILITSSVAGLMPGPFEAVYAASKAFLRWFGEALRNELAEKGIGVTVLMPGPTDTDFFQRANMENTPAGQGPKDDPALVARQAYDALMADRHAVIAGGLKNKLESNAVKWLNDPLRARAHRMETEPLDRESEKEGGLSPAAIGGLFFVGALAAAGTAAWLQSRGSEEEIDQRTRRRLDPKRNVPEADFEVASRS